VSTNGETRENQPECSYRRQTQLASTQPLCWAVGLDRAVVRVAISLPWSDVLQPVLQPDRYRSVRSGSGEATVAEYAPSLSHVPMGDGRH
jgi:hypothetical protein